MPSTTLKILHPLGPADVHWDRHAAIVDRCVGARVLHLGCVDHGYETRLATGELLHQKLATVASTLWGVDINAPGIARMREAGIPQLLCADVTTLAQEPAVADQTFDVIVAAELLEHLSAPGTFLTSARALMAGKKTRLLITVPNAARLDSFVYGLAGTEVVHPDHVAWYTPRTLRALLERHGFTVVRVDMYAHRSALIRADGAAVRRRGLLPRVAFRTLKLALVSRAPLLADGLIVEAVCAS